MSQCQRGIDAPGTGEDAKWNNARAAENANIIKYVKGWANAIELQGYFSHIVAEDERQVAMNLMELLEKCATTWAEEPSA